MHINRFKKLANVALDKGKRDGYAFGYWRGFRDAWPVAILAFLLAHEGAYLAIYAVCRWVPLWLLWLR